MGVRSGDLVRGDGRWKCSTSIRKLGRDVVSSGGVCGRHGASLG